MKQALITTSHTGGWQNWRVPYDKWVQILDK